MKALVTGFEPFAGADINPAAEVVRRLPASLGVLAVERLVLPVVFGRSLTLLAEAVEAVAPDLVLTIGLAGGRPGLSLERVAINLDDARIPDNAGQQPIDRKIIEGGPAAYFTTLPIKTAAQALRGAGLPASVSNSAGTFVCNHVFYGLMHLAATRYPGLRAGFLHLPYLPQQAAADPAAPSMAIEHMTQGVEIVLAVAAATRGDPALPGGSLS